jgi:hypothetical protein
MNTTTPLNPVAIGLFLITTRPINTKFEKMREHEPFNYMVEFGDYWQKMRYRCLITNVEFVVRHSCVETLTSMITFDDKKDDEGSSPSSSLPPHQDKEHRER